MPTISDPPPSSRVALVTGGAGAIGAAVCERLARRGIAVAIIDIDADRAAAVARSVARQTGVACLAVPADISDAGAVRRAVQRVTDDVGPIDTLVNNAGTLQNAPLSLMTEGDWDAVLDVHLKGAFLCSRAVLPHMTTGRFGRIINISSGAVRGSDRGHANYASAKAGLLGLTTALAAELGPWGITVNAVAPGVIRSDMTRATADQLGQTFAEYEDSRARSISVRRIGEPEDVAHAVAFFAGEQASFVNGQVLFVAGGP